RSCSSTATRRGRYASNGSRITRRGSLPTGSRPRATASFAAGATCSWAPPRARRPRSSRSACTGGRSRAASSSGRCSRRTPSRSSAASGAPEPPSSRYAVGRRPESRSGRIFPEACGARCAAQMQETIHQPTRASEATDGLAAAALRAEAWAGEPFLHSDEDPAEVLAPGTARRRALDEALAEIEDGRDVPSPEWKIRFALMLGLERVLSERPPHTNAGTELRRHQIDALAGMLTELIAANQKEAENGNGYELEQEDEED